MSSNNARKASSVDQIAISLVGGSISKEEARRIVETIMSNISERVAVGETVSLP